MRKILAKVDDVRLGLQWQGCWMAVSWWSMCGAMSRVPVRVFGALAMNSRCTLRVSGCNFYGHRTYCKHITAVALHELGVAAKARSERRKLTGLVL